MQMELELPTLQLPTEIWTTIFDYLPHSEVKWMRLVCKQWAILAITPTFISKSTLVLSLEENEKMNCIKRYIEEKGELFMRFENLVINCTEWHYSYSMEYECVFQKIAPHVRHLILEYESGFEMDFRYFEKLTALILSGYTDAKKFLQQLVDDTTKTRLNIQKLTVGFCNVAEDLALVIKVLQKYATTLTDLAMNIVIDSQSDTTIKAWIDAFRQLRSLKCLDIRGVSDEDWLVAIFNALPKEAPIQKLHLPNFDLKCGHISRKWSATLSCLSIDYCDDESLAPLRHAVNLRELNLSCSDKLTRDGVLNAISTRRFTAMRILRLDTLRILDDEVICKMVTQFPNLEELEFRNKSGLTRHSLATVFEHLKGLQVFSLGIIKDVTDDDLLGCDDKAYSIQNLRQLRVLKLTHCPGITKRTLMEGCQLPELRKVILYGMYSIKAADIKEFVELCPSLDRVDYRSGLTEVIYQKGSRVEWQLNGKACESNAELDAIQVCRPYL